MPALAHRPARPKRGALPANHNVFLSHWGRPFARRIGAVLSDAVTTQAPSGFGAERSAEDKASVALDQARIRFLKFFTANNRNPNTRRAYAKTCEEFLAWCLFAGVLSIVSPDALCCNCLICLVVAPGWNPGPTD